MKIPEEGSMILDRNTSKCWIACAVTSHSPREDYEESNRWQAECKDYLGEPMDVDDRDVHDDETRFVNLEPIQVLEQAKHLTCQAVSCLDAKKQRELCLEAIWLLQWFSKE